MPRKVWWLFGFEAPLFFMLLLVLNAIADLQYFVDFMKQDEICRLQIILLVDDGIERFGKGEL